MFCFSVFTDPSSFSKIHFCFQGSVLIFIDLFSIDPFRLLIDVFSFHCFSALRSKFVGGVFLIFNNNWWSPGPMSSKCDSLSQNLFFRLSFCRSYSCFRRSSSLRPGEQSKRNSACISNIRPLSIGPFVGTRGTNS